MFIEIIRKFHEEVKKPCAFLGLTSLGTGKRLKKARNTRVVPETKAIFIFFRIGIFYFLQILTVASSNLVFNSYYYFLKI